MKLLDSNIYFFQKAIFCSLLICDLFDVFIPRSIGRIGDEICCVVVMLFCIGFILASPQNSPIGKKILTFMLLMTILGCLGNIFFPYRNDISLVFRSVFFFLKPFFFALFSVLFVNRETALKCYSFFHNVSRFMIISIFCTAVLNHLFHFGLEKYGLFTFFSTSTSGVVAWWLILFVAIIFSGHKHCFFYLALSIISLNFIDSGLGTFCMIMVFPVYFFFENKERMKIHYFLLLAPLALLLGANEINEYLRNDSAPRYLFFSKSFIIAFNCFPIGCGFGTFADNTAMEYYSILYDIFDFSSNYGMSRDNKAFLMDSYYPMIIAQFGFLGCIIFISLIVYIVKMVVLIIANKKIKIWTTYLFFAWLAAGLGFGIGSNWGCCIFLLIGTALKIQRNEFT